MVSFTFVFRSIDNYQLSYQLAFEPCPVWKVGEEIIFNPHQTNPELLETDFADFIAFLEKNDTQLSLNDEKKVFLIADRNWLDNGGYVGENALQLLTDAAKREGFDVKTLLI